jgi:hypothetical protein
MCRHREVGPAAGWGCPCAANSLLDNAAHCMFVHTYGSRGEGGAAHARFMLNGAGEHAQIPCRHSPAAMHYSVLKASEYSVMLVQQRATAAVCSMRHQVNGLLCLGLTRALLMICKCLELGTCVAGNVATFGTRSCCIPRTRRLTTSRVTQKFEAFATTAARCKTCARICCQLPIKTQYDHEHTTVPTGCSAAMGESPCSQAVCWAAQHAATHHTIN